MSEEKTYQGSCFCGDIQFTVTGAPDAMGYCHCESCRHWSGGPVNDGARPVEVTFSVNTRSWA